MSDRLDESERLSVGDARLRGFSATTQRRLVALWNACAGVATGDLEITAWEKNPVARLAQLGLSVDAAFERAKEPK